MTGVYCIENSVNGRKYIGQSTDIEKRWRQHRQKLRNGKHNNMHLQRAWEEYGETAFLFYVLELCDEMSLSAREIYYIEKFNSFESGYNMTQEGEGTRSCLHTEEYKKRMSEMFAGRHFSDETIRKMSEAKKGKPLPRRDPEKVIAGYKSVSKKLKGRKFTDEHRKNISEAKKGRQTWNKGMKFPPESHPMYGKHLSESAKQKISRANKGKVRTEEQRLKCAKKVLCVETGEIFQSATDAASSCGVTVSAISRVLRGKSNTCKSLHWRYAEGSGMS